MTTNNRRYTGRFVVRDDNPLVREHRVHGVHLMPGVALTDLILKVLKSTRVEACTVTLSDVIFFEPVITGPKLERHLEVSLRPLDATKFQAEVHSVSSVDGALGTEQTRHMMALVTLTDAALATPERLSVPSASVYPTSLDECYAVTRHVGIEHQDFMQCDGSVLELPDGGCLARVRLSERAWAHASDFLLHPVAIDCSTIVPLFFARHALAQLQLYIPFAIRELTIFEPPSTREVLVHVEAASEDDFGAGREIVYRNFTIHDLTGRALVRIRGFGVKRVRSLAEVQRFEAVGQTAAQPAKRATPLAVDPVGSAMPNGCAQVGGASAHTSLESITALITELVVRFGEHAWQPGDEDREFFALGLDSLSLLDISDALEKKLSVQLYPTLLFEQPTVSALARHLAEASAPAMPAATASAATPDDPALSLLAPRWRESSQPLESPRQATSAALLALGPNPLLAPLSAADCARVRHQVVLDGVPSTHAEIEAAVQPLVQAMRHDDAITDLYIVVPPCDPERTLPRCAVHDVVFELVQQLIKPAATTRKLTLRLVTFQAAQLESDAELDPEPQGAWGLLASLSREYPDISVASFDLQLADPASEWVAFVCSPIQTRQRLALRSQRRFVQRLVPIERNMLAGNTLRQGGTYVVIGGGRGLGWELASHLIQRYEARVAVIGRSPFEGEIAQRCASLGEAAQRIVYKQLSVTDEAALSRAFDEIAAEFGPIHGIVHSALVLDDRRLSELDRASFARVLSPKVEGARSLARASAGLELDFLVFFSSVQSFIGNRGQANYAAASTFLDAYAQQLANQRTYPVVTVNWGYWSAVGAVASDHYRELMRRAGMHGLAAEEALAAFEQVLGSGLRQVAIVRAEPAVLIEMGTVEGITLTVKPGARRAPEPALPTLAESFVLRGQAAVAGAEQQLAKLLPSARKHIAESLAALGCIGPDGRVHASDEAVAAGKLGQDQVQLYEAVVVHLRDAGVLLERSGSLFAQPAPGSQEVPLAATLRQLAAADPEMHCLTRLLGRCLEAFGDLLCGRVTGRELMFPGGTTELVRGVYAAQPVSTFFNQVVAAAACSASRVAATTPLRVLEIGAGTGATALAVMAQLESQGIPVEYVFTDVWDKFIQEARALRQDVGGMTFGYLDIEHDPRIQNQADDYDVVIATNVLHATRNIRRSLRHAKLLLKAGGTLIVNESTRVQEFSTYTFGTLSGWWHAEDGELRLMRSPLLDRGAWLAALRAEGYCAAELPLPEAARVQSVFIATSDGEIVAPAVQRSKLRAAPIVVAPEPTRAQLEQRALPAGDAARLPAGAVPLHTRAQLSAFRAYQDPSRGIWLLLDHPPGNMFTLEVIEELCALLRDLKESSVLRDSSQFLYLSHVGRYFSLGGDREYILRHLQTGDSAVVGRFVAGARELSSLLTSLDAIVVAVAHGAIQGGGLELLFSTDFQVLAQSVKVGLPEVKSGLIPGMGGLTYLQQQIGSVNAKRLTLLGELLSADQAKLLGLVSHVALDPIAAALQLQETVPNLSAALYMKHVLNRERGSLLAADLESWADYLRSHEQSINGKRIGASHAVLQQLDPG